MDSDKISGIMDKIESKASLIGGVFGFIQHPIAVAGGFNETTFGVMMDAIQAWHPPNPMKILQMEWQFPDRYPIMANIMTSLGGWVLQQFGPVIDSRLGQLGRITKKLGVSMLISNIASGFIWSAQYNPGGASGGYGTAGMGTSTQSVTNPMWSGAPGGPGAPHATQANGYSSGLTFEKVVA